MHILENAQVGEDKGYGNWAERGLMGFFFFKEGRKLIMFRIINDNKSSG